MSVYRDAGHCIARVMSIETNTCTPQSAWQKRYQSGFPELPPPGSGLSAEERLTQDAMTRALIHRELHPHQWAAIVAKYSINEWEVIAAVGYLVRQVESPAHQLFVTKAVTAWAVPRRLPESFYLLHTWDNEGTPDRTLRRWRGSVNRWLNDRVDEAHGVVEVLLKLNGLLIGEAA